MSRQQIENFDAWESVFSRKTDDFTNELWQKVQAFYQSFTTCLIYNQITDYITTNIIYLGKPGEIGKSRLSLKPKKPVNQMTYRLLMCPEHDSESTNHHHQTFTWTDLWEQITKKLNIPFYLSMRTGDSVFINSFTHFSFRSNRTIRRR